MSETPGKRILCGPIRGLGVLEVHILTLFPEAIEAYIGTSILGRAQADGRLAVHLVDFRQFSTDRHRTVDDRPFGGGPGMVLQAEPIFTAVEQVEENHGPCRKILLTPVGRVLNQDLAADFSKEERLLLLCGRYEGFDERIRQGLDWTEVSLGDFVLSGGEIPALAVLESTARLLPGVLGHEESAKQDSFGESGILDHPHYTRPAVFRGMAVPEVLLSGDHQAIEAWRADQARQRTLKRRPDILPDSD